MYFPPTVLAARCISARALVLVRRRPSGETFMNQRDNGMTLYS